MSFAVRSELSALPVVSKRLGWSIDAMRKTGQRLEYDLNRASVFDVYVPADYDGSSTYGLIVWISFGGGGQIPIQGWSDVLDRHKLIWIGPGMAGNDQYWPIRVGKGLDAAANMKSLYRIDDRRVYAAGLSGGGRAASMLGVGFPDVFTGGCYIVGCDFYRDVPLGVPGKFWARNFFAPPRPLFTLAKTRSRYVLFTGEGDINREQTECNYKAFLNDGFEHVTLLEPPALGHGAPDPEWFEKGIEALDANPVATTQRSRPKTSAASTPSSVPASNEAENASRQLHAAQLYIDARLYPQARQRLTEIISQHPGSPEAARAKLLLEQIAGK